MIWVVLEKLHGHMALLAIAACFHPPIVLRKARRPSWPTRVSGYAASALLASSVGLGWFIYPEYRRQIRQHLYTTNPLLGRAFEIKEHLGTFALFLVVAGAILLWLSTRPGGAELRKSTARAYLCAAILASTSAVLGIIIASAAGFTR